MSGEGEMCDQKNIGGGISEGCNGLVCGKGLYCDVCFNCIGPPRRCNTCRKPKGEYISLFTGQDFRF